MIYVDRFKTGDIKLTRVCSSSQPGPRMYCENEDEDPDHRVYCCYEDMCNTGIIITLPTVTPSAVYTDKGNVTDKV